MKSLVLLLGCSLVCTMNQPLRSSVYHLVGYTVSEPVLLKFGVEPDTLDQIVDGDMYYGLVRETIDEHNRCLRLEFLMRDTSCYESVDMPSIVEYSWNESSLLERLEGGNGKLFKKDEFVRPNKVLYEWNKSNRTCVITRSFNDSIVESDSVTNCRLDSAVTFFSFSQAKAGHSK